MFLSGNYSVGVANTDKNIRGQKLATITEVILNFQSTRFRQSSLVRAGHPPYGHSIVYTIRTHFDNFRTQMNKLHSLQRDSLIPPCSLHFRMQTTALTKQHGNGCQVNLPPQSIDRHPVFSLSLSHGTTEQPCEPEQFAYALSIRDILLTLCANRVIIMQYDFELAWMGIYPMRTTVKDGREVELCLQRH